MILTSLGLAVAAGRHYASRGASRALVTLGTLLVVMLAWAAINVIVFAGWEFPPSRAH